MKVAFVSDWFAPRRGGIEAHLQGLGAALTRAGAQVVAITGQPGAVSSVAGVPAITLPGLRIPGLDLAASPRLARYVENALVASNPDVVHVHASIVAPCCLAAALAARRLDLPMVVTCHSDMRLAARPLAALATLLGPAHDRVIFTGVSARVATQISERLRAAAPRVLANGFDAKFWSKGAGLEKPRAGTFRIVSALRLTRKKRPGVLLDLKEQVARQTGRPVELVLAGDGHMRAAFEGRAQVTGWLNSSALRDLYRSADLFVAPSRREAFGIAALEARAAGLPVIGRAGTGLSDFIAQGEDGFLAINDTEMAVAAARLATDPALLDRLSGPRPGLERYDWATITRQHLAVYEEAISARRG